MFYQTRAFLAACVAAALGLVAIAWRLHLRRVRTEMSILIAERARLAREIHLLPDAVDENGMLSATLTAEAIGRPKLE